MKKAAALILCVLFLPTLTLADADMRRGSRGEGVLEAQQMLIELGYLSGPADGIFGPKTEAAAKAFERTIGHRPDGRLNIAELDELDFLWCDATGAMEGDGLSPEELAERYPSGCSRTDDKPGAVDYCWRHFEAGAVTAKLRLPGLPDEAVRLLAARALQLWTESIGSLYDEWEQENGAVAREQRALFETSRAQQRAAFTGQYGEGSAEALRAEALWLAEICVDRCFDLHTAEGNGGAMQQAAQ